MIRKIKSFSHNQASRFDSCNHTTNKGRVFTLSFYLNSTYKWISKKYITNYF